MFSYNGADRLTIKQIREHPWMTGEKVNMEKSRNDIIGQLSEVRSSSTVDTMRDDQNCRGDDYKSMIREVESFKDLQLRGFNDKNEFDIEVAPGVVYEDLCAWNSEVYKDAMKIEVVEKKGEDGMNKPRNILLTVKDPESVASVETEDGVAAGAADEIVVKVKFFKAADDKDGRTRVRFHRKRGDMIEWAKIFGEMKKTHLNDILLLRESICNRNERSRKTKKCI